MTPQTTRNQKLAAHLLLIAVTAIWGATFTLVKSALADVSPLLFNLIRMALAFAILAAIHHRSLRNLTKRDLQFGAIAGLFLGLGYQFQTSGLAHTTAAKSGLITGLVVVIVPLLSMIPLARHHTASKPGLPAFTGAALAFVGLIFLTIPPGSGSAIFSGLGLGEYLTLACAIAFAAHLLTLSQASAVVNAPRLATLQIGFTTLVLLVTLPFGGHPHIHLTTRLITAFAITAIFATAAAFTIQSWAQQHLPASHTALIFTLEPVFAWLTSLIFLHERFGPRAFIGAALILAGILAAELAPTFRKNTSILIPG
jgi:drug/metabolite transporter (DMT)-like permease